MKEPERAINKRLLFNRFFSYIVLNEYGSFTTIPNSLKQLPVKNLNTWSDFLLGEVEKLRPMNSVYFKG